MIKLVAFDLDGTIGDTIPMCMQAFKMSVEPYIDYILSDEDILKTFGLDEEGMIKQVITSDNWKKGLDDFYRIYQEMHALCPHPFDGIVKLIEELKDRSIPVVLITGKGKGSCQITLQWFEMENYFDRIETGSPEKNRKSEAMNSLLVEYKLNPNEMVYVGDAVSDILFCQQTGVKCLSAAWAKSADFAVLEKYNKGNVFESISSLKECLFPLLNEVKKI